MDENNRELLSEVTGKFLTAARDAELGSEEQKVAWEMAMDAIDRQNKVSAIDEAYREHVEKLEAENERRDKELEATKEQQTREEALKKAELKKTIVIKCVEIAAISILTPILNNEFKKRMAKFCMNYEKTDSLMMTPGKSVTRDIFRWKD